LTILSTLESHLVMATEVRTVCNTCNSFDFCVESGMLQLLENLGTGALPTIENSAAITTHLPPGAINVIESLGDLSIVGGKGGSRDRDDRDGGKPML